MRTHGWAGSPPVDDDEALMRIIDAARQGIDEHRRVPRVAEVARELGVSRATVYRYVRDSDELLLQLAAHEAIPFVEELARDLAGEASPSRAAVRAVVHVVDRLPRNPYLALAFAPGSPTSQVAGITSSAARAFGLEMLRAVEVDWEGAGFGEQELAQLVELMLRLVQSFVLDPGDPPRTAAELESYLTTWLVPAVGALARA